tara:strand:+ start:436 stop:642 length:207 start_codon:yes stop_codon:yes gene_type:complete
MGAVDRSLMKKNECSCGSFIAKKNPRHYKGFCCKNVYKNHLRNFGKKSTDRVEESNKRVVGRLNKLFK